MEILITGASGFIGSSVAEHFKSQGHSVRILTRRSDPKSPYFFDAMQGSVNSAALENVEAVIHLAGENIVGRWTSEKKRRIRESRVHGTQVLSQALAGLSKKPKVFLCASAIGFYGDRGDETLTESSSPGSGFLAEACQAWEGVTQTAEQAGIRTVNLRLGIVLSPKGGALAKMLMPFKLGLGGRIGDGIQYWSWISLDDVVGAIDLIFRTPEISGPVNIVSPEPVTNETFTKTLGEALHRPTIFPMPATAARAVFGEMADAMFLASSRVMPAALRKAGYKFKHPTLSGALQEI